MLLHALVILKVAVNKLTAKLKVFHFNNNKKNLQSCKGHSYASLGSTCFQNRNIKKLPLSCIYSRTKCTTSGAFCLVCLNVLNQVIKEHVFE